MELNGVKVGLAITGSFCTFNKVYSELEKLVNAGAVVTPIFSYNGANLDTRFGKADEWVEKFETLTGKKSIMTVADAEPIGPKNYFDVLVIAPCTGNTALVQNYIDARNSIMGIIVVLAPNTRLVLYLAVQYC